MKTPRAEYPRPDFERDCWLSLNGEWSFSFNKPTFDQKIMVPFACESKLSGINDQGFHDIVWYQRSFKVPNSFDNKRVLLHFGAVDYQCRVWLNDNLIKEHSGGNSSFAVEITDLVVKNRENTIKLEVIDEHQNLELPRGKQFWELKPRSIFYNRTTGIWQSVWLEGVGNTYLESVRITPLLDEKAVKIDYQINGNDSCSLNTEISFNGVKVSSLVLEPVNNRGSYTIELNQKALNSWNFFEDLTWSPEHPRLFDLEFKISNNNKLEDSVKSYFGMRKVSIENGNFMLNNHPYYQKLILNQGYWPESLLTAPSDKAFVDDIMAVKNMGFNGVRIHQKIEDPRYLYYADKLGILVWEEMASAYLYSCQYAIAMYNEWTQCIMRDYNHPSIVAWTPLNESWGVQEVSYSQAQQNHVAAMYHLTKSLDESRIVMDNDGWEHMGGDFLTIHDYSESGKLLKEHFKDLNAILSFEPGGHKMYVDSAKYHNQPIIVSEFGGIKFNQKEEKDNWGYSQANNGKEFFKQYESMVVALKSCKEIKGYCYTQLTDVETEHNGLMTYDRKFKIPVEEISKVNSFNE